MNLIKNEHQKRNFCIKKAKSYPAAGGCTPKPSLWYTTLTICIEIYSIPNTHSKNLTKQKHFRTYCRNHTRITDRKPNELSKQSYKLQNFNKSQSVYYFPKQASKPQFMKSTFNWICVANEFWCGTTGNSMYFILLNKFDNWFGIALINK